MNEDKKNGFAEKVIGRMIVHTFGYNSFGRVSDGDMEGFNINSIQ